MRCLMRRESMLRKSMIRRGLRDMLWHWGMLRMWMGRLMLRDRARMAILRKLAGPGRLLRHRRGVRVIDGGVRHIGKAILRWWGRRGMRMLLGH